MGSVETRGERLGRPVRDLACLVVVAGTGIGEKIPLATDRLVIGRQPDADVCLIDALVSRHHAEIVVDQDGFLLRDLSSRNGTFCNERQVTERILEDGDLIHIGGSAFKYVGRDSIEHLYLSVMADRARMDGLTGLFNKQTFQDYLERTVLRCRDLREPLSVVLLDIDWFKRVNDRWGHPAGDAVLQETAGLLKDGFRPTDLFARVGGEELGLILPYTDADGALKVGERMRKRVAEHAVVFEGHTIGVTVSVGVADMGEDVDEALLVARADQALYAAKKQGRNRTMCFDDAARGPSRRRKAA
ncbi:MAG: GGDEF domain-containing protein [Nitrospiria bacterium]